MYTFIFAVLINKVSINPQSLQFLYTYQEVKDDQVVDNDRKQVGEIRLKLQIQNS